MKTVYSTKAKAKQTNKQNEKEKKKERKNTNNNNNNNNKQKTNKYGILIYNVKRTAIKNKIKLKKQLS